MRLKQYLTFSLSSQDGATHIPPLHYEAAAKMAGKGPFYAPPLPPACNGTEGSAYT